MVKHSTFNRGSVGSIPTWRTIIKKTEGDKTMSENYIVINGKKAELTEEQLEKLGIEVLKNRRDRVNKYQPYYFVDYNNLVLSTYEAYDTTGDYCYYSHNYFKIKEDADKYARVLKTEMLLRQYADEHNEDMPWDGRYRHYFFYYNVDSNVIHTDYYTFSKEARKIYFSSREITEAAIEKIGEERIKEYLTYEW